MQSLISIAADLSWPFAITLAWVVGEFGHRWTGLPRISFYGVIGFVLAQTQVGVLPQTDAGPMLVLADVAFGLILFEVGYRINLRWLKNNPWIAVTGLVESLLTFAVVYFIGIEFGSTSMTALLLASLARSTSPATILRIVRDEEIKNFKLEFDFGQNDESEDGEGVDFTGQTPVGPCPKCNAGVYEMGLAYVCEHSMAKPKTCDFRSGRIILQQEILPEQMAKLLNDGKTDLLPGFVSQRTRRPFKAFLVRGKDGKVSFEFEERKAKPGAKTKAAAAEVEGEEGAAPAKKTAVKKAAAVKKAPAKKAAAVKKPAAKKAPAKKAAAAE